MSRVGPSGRVGFNTTVIPFKPKDGVSFNDIILKDKNIVSASIER